MKASEAKLEAILNSPYRYIVPVFQRFYTWRKDNWKELWGNILELLELPEERSDKTHFMGALVFVPEKLLPNVTPTFQIIDGQQRMMTITILLCAIRNIADSYDYSSLAQEINDTFLVHPYKEGKERYRVYPRHQDKADFELAITNESTPENRVGDTLSFFTQRILENPNLCGEEGLRRLFQLVGSKLEFVHITLDQENPYRIFRSLNSTGVDLSEGDLIRNYVFMHLPTEQQDIFDNHKWKPLEERFTDDKGNLDGKLISAFFRDFLMLDGTYIPVSDTYQSFEERYPSGEFDPHIIVKDIQACAALYSFIIGRNTHPDKNVEIVLSKLRELDSSTAYPLVLRLMREDIGYDELAMAINWISSFILRRFVCQDSSRAYSRWFSTACQKLGDPPLEGLRRFLISKGFPSDVRFNESMTTFHLYGRRYTHAILSRIERASKHKEPADLSKCQVEHIMPQTITNPWKRDLGEKAAEVHEKWLHTIGNLTLTGYNPELSNKPFDDKKTDYENSHITMNEEIAKLETWDEAAIVKRADKLAETAIEIWEAPEDLSPGSVGASEISGKANGDKVSKIRYMISRREVSRGQMAIYEKLYDAEEKGLSSSELAKSIGRTRAQLAGILGALGKRINKTEGLDDDQGIVHVFQMWQVKKDWYYRMKPELKDAIELEGILDSK